MFDNRWVPLLLSPVCLVLSALYSTCPLTFIFDVVSIFCYVELPVGWI